MHGADTNNNNNCGTDNNNSSTDVPQRAAMKYIEEIVCYTVL